MTKRTMWIAASLFLSGTGRAEIDPSYMDHYTQEFTVEFADADSAGRAGVAILPLYAGHEWAVSARWDDNIATDMKMREVMEKHGYRGTFYLNATDDYYYGPDYGLIARADYPRMAGRLLAGGNSIGGHSLTHPHLTVICRNGIFHEVLGGRADRESSTGVPINTFSFPFCDYRDDTEGDAVRDDIAELMRRAGYCHIAEPWFGADFTVSNLLPTDGAGVDAAFAAFLADPALKEREPNISFNMHVWYTTPEAWSRFEGQLEKYARNPGFWYCNQGEYAAYRHQYRNTRMERSVHGKKVVVRLARPALSDLGDPVPLTFAVTGVPPEKVNGVTGSGARVEALRSGKEFRFNLRHGQTQGLPVRIARVDFAEGETGEKETPDFPGLKVRMWINEGIVAWGITNSGTVLAGLVATARLPLPWRPGVVRSAPVNIGHDRSGGGSVRLDAPPGGTDFKLISGTAYYCVQLDFTRDGRRCRLYLSCRAAGRDADPGYPRDGFLVLGPLGDDEKAAIDVATRTLTAGGKSPSLAAEAGGREWRRTGRDQAVPLDPEMILTRGKGQSDNPEYYLLWSSVVSDVAQKAGYRCAPGQIKAVFLRGRRVEGNTLELARGKNELLLAAYSGKGKFSSRHYGAFFRLTGTDGVRRSRTNASFAGDGVRRSRTNASFAGDGARLKNISYRPDNVASGENR